MGLNFFARSSSSYESKVSYTPNVVTLPNPDPSNYKILISEVIGKNLVLMINYPDCTNYEGNKILVFKNCTRLDLQKQKVLDPHFSNNCKFKSPFARFEPSDEGWESAIRLAKII